MTQTRVAKGPWTQTRPSAGAQAWMLLWHCMATQITQISMAMLVAQLLDTHMATGDSPDTGHPYGPLVTWAMGS